MRSIKPLKRFMVLLMIFPLLAGLACSLPQALHLGDQQGRTDSGNSQNNEEMPEKEVIAGSEAGGDTTEVRFQPEGFEPSSLAIPSFGSIQFNADSDSGALQELTPGNAATDLQVVDQAGLTWTLSFPEGALESKQMIRMVPLTQLDQRGYDKSLGGVVSGVRLEPDGLTFLQPVQLSVSGAELNGLTFILSGSHSGSEISYTLQEPEAANPTAQILHFSTYFASQPENDQLQEIENNAAKAYKNLSKEVRKLRNTPLDIPVPPSISLECKDEKGQNQENELVNSFVNNALNPEATLLLQLLQQRRILALVGNTDLENNWDAEIALALRTTQKATALMDQYSGQEDKLVPVTQFAITAARNLAVIGGDQTVVQEILSKLASWNSDLVDKLIEDIHTNHQYKKIPVVLQIARNAQLLGGQVNTESFLEKVKQALRFEVEYTFEVFMPDIHNITKAVIPIQFDINEGWLSHCEGNGQGDYEHAEISEPEFTVDTFPYPVQVVVKDFDPCKGTVMLGMDRFGSDQDTMTFTTEDFSETSPWPISRNASMSLFDEELDSGLYWFQLPVENGNATAAQLTLERSKFDTVEGILTVRLIHK